MQQTAYDVRISGCISDVCSSDLVQQRVDADVGARREVGLELVPELRRLVAEVPGPALAARAEHPLLGPRRLLVAADAGDHPLEGVLRSEEHPSEPSH